MQIYNIFVKNEQLVVENKKQDVKKSATLR